MAVQYDKTGKLFQVSYAAPFGGIDTTSYASAIDPKNFAAMTTAIVNANKLTPIAWEQLIALTMADSESFLGYVPVAESSTIGYIITTNAVTIVASDGAGGLTFTSVSPYSPATATYGYFSYVVIDELVIWTTETWNEIWSFDTTTNTISLLTDYVGGGYLGVLDNQLINLGGVSNLDGEVPYRISWSAPGQYGQFQPYDVGSGSGNYAAGSNDLPSTSDVLVGMITTGTVAYLFRSQGITQMAPTGNGIQPFTFNHLWASQLGIGTVLPDSIAQYGGSGAFIADSGFYSLGISGLAEITGAAKELLFNQINNIPNFATNAALPQGIVTAICVPYLNSHPSVYYVIGILNSMTSFTEGTPPSSSTYAIYAIDLNNGYTCYDLGTQVVAADPTIPSANAVGKLSFINKAYSSAPSPAPPSPPSYSLWANTTFYTPYNCWEIAQLVGFSRVPYLYSLTTSGVITTGAVQPTNPPPAAIGDTITVGTAVFTYKGSGIWTAGQTEVLGQFIPLRTGSAPYFTNFIYVVTQAGVAGGSQTGWSTIPGAIVNDGTAVLQCIGPVSQLLPDALTPSNATTYNVAANSIINDPSNFLQQNTNTAVNDYSWTAMSTTFYITLPGGFSQAVAPTWNNTTGGATDEVGTLITPIPPATWICLGAKPSPPTTLVGANIAQIVPLFITINNGTTISLQSTFNAIKLIAPLYTSVGTIYFKKEQFVFGYIPTITKVGFIAAQIDPSQASSIAVSVDGGASFSTFPVINTFPGTLPQSTIDPYSDVFSDAVQSLERPQLVIRLTNVIIAECWYQGTLADFPLI